MVILSQDSYLNIPVDISSILVRDYLYLLYFILLEVVLIDFDLLSQTYILCLSGYNFPHVDLEDETNNWHKLCYCSDIFQDIAFIG